MFREYRANGTSFGQRLFILDQAIRDVRKSKASILVVISQMKKKGEINPAKGIMSPVSI